MPRLPLLVSLAFLTAMPACRAEFEAEIDPLVGTWNLLSVEGLGCAVTDGDMTIDQGAATGALGGTFDWSAMCNEGEPIDETNVIENVEVDVSGRDYGIDVRQTSPGSRVYDWDCVMNGDALDCTETGDTVLIFEFQREV